MIVFSYLISDFINNTQILSMYRADNVLNQEDRMGNDIAVSYEDEKILRKYLKTGCGLVLNLLSAYTVNLVDVDGVTPLEAMEFDVTHDSVEHSIVFRVNMPSTFNQAVIPAMDESIKDALESYVLYRVSRQKQIESDSYFQNFETAQKEIRGYLTRRKEMIKRSYRIF